MVGILQEACLESCRNLVGRLDEKSGWKPREEFELKPGGNFDKILDGNVEGNLN